MTNEDYRSPIHGRGDLAALGLAALGVVYGDIGTSPLYTIRECFFGGYAVPPTSENVLGVLSLVFWALVIVVSIKYFAFILRADNRGEGGILALMALIGSGRDSEQTSSRRWLIAMGLFGAALLYGDGMITPAISVLSAVEGLGVATSLFEPYVLPITVVILVALFLFQSRGTAGIGAVFGPISLAWFLVIGVLGLLEIIHTPEVLTAVNPLHGVDFFVLNQERGLLVLGAVFLAVTGGEALYADIGHFGKRPIRVAWFGIVLPALLLNYFGQGALLLGDPDAAHNPFYRLVPTWALYPMVVLATLATIIASQAVISGAFSLTRQAVQLGYCPRLEIDHTSSREIGQIYVPFVNWVLMLATLALVIGFGSSSRLAAAYGVAVTTTMGITTLLFYVVARELWGWRFWIAAPLAAGLMAIDLAFFSANIIKIEHGGWFPLLVAWAVFVLMSTWKRGRRILADKLGMQQLPAEHLLADIATRPPTRVPGTAVFMTATAHGVPVALLHNLKHNKVLHETVIFLTLVTEEIPYVPEQQCVQVRALGHGIYRITARVGFMEDPNVPRLLSLVRTEGLDLEVMTTSFFLGRETLVPSKSPAMPLWREWLFAAMSRNAQGPTAFFGIPPNRVVELGAQVQL